MNNLSRIIIILLVISFTACTSTLPYMHASNDEDKDIGLGGTGLQATANSEDNDSGMGGTGILGEITGFGSVFVNGIEIEYGSETAFTVNGKTTTPLQLEIGDVVEVLTTDVNKHTQAQIINLRHEVIGKVESIDPQTYSFTVQGHTVIQPIDKRLLPDVGSSVAVSGFRVDKQTIVSTRVTPADAEQSLLRTHTELPFKEKTARWLVQMHVQNNKAVFQLEGAAHVLSIKKKAKQSFADHLGIRILQLQKPAAGQLKFERVIEPLEMPRGQPSPMPGQWRGGNKIHKPMPGSIPGPQPGSGYGAGQGGGTGSGQGGGKGSGQGPQSGAGQSI